MIKAIVLDDGYHEKSVIINAGINYYKKSLRTFVNELCSRHSADYQVKTAHSEDLAEDFSVYFDELDREFDKYFPFTTLYFQLLWESGELADGIDIY